MIIRYDPSVDAAYIYLVPLTTGVQAARTVPVDPIEAGAEINLDFDDAGRLVGIEVLRASRHLPEALINDAEIL
jgi:uncharacterized protein YuzE